MLRGLVTRTPATYHEGLAVKVGAAHTGPGDVQGPGLVIIAARKAPGPEQETSTEWTRGKAE